jgi:sec-independent protein translocase protein TatA
MIPNIGPLEIGIVLIIALVVFGPKRLPELGSSLGHGIRGFGKGLKGDEEAVASPDPVDQSAIQTARAETAAASGKAEVS